MSRKNLAVKHGNNGGKPQALRVEKAAGKVSGELDKVIHERMRLGIVSALAVNAELSFNELKTLMKTTDGNLSVHARKLEEADYIVCNKTFKDRMPHTVYKLTPKGIKALKHYLEHMEALIRVTRNAKI